VSRLLPPAFVLFVWLALWGEISVANVVSGILVVTLIGLIIRPVPREHTLAPLALLRLLAVFVWRLFSSSMIVVAAVVAPTPARLRSGVVAVRLQHRSNLVATIVADAISLTPGTLTLDAHDPDHVEQDPPGAEEHDGEAPADGSDHPPHGDTPVLYIHVLGLDNPDAVRDDVRRLEELVIAAVTPNEAVSGGDTP